MPVLSLLLGLFATDLRAEGASSALVVRDKATVLRLLRKFAMNVDRRFGRIRPRHNQFPRVRGRYLRDARFLLERKKVLPRLPRRLRNHPTNLVRLLPEGQDRDKALLLNRLH